MPQVYSSDFGREAGAMLHADLATSYACTLEGLRVTAAQALAALYRTPQRVTVARGAMGADRVSLRSEGPDCFGSLELYAPGCD